MVGEIGDRADGCRLRALVVLLWRAGLRIREALALQESDLDRRRGAVLVWRGKGGKRRELGMDRWAWEHPDRGLRSEPTFRLVRCCVCCTDRPLDVTGKHRPHASSSIGRPHKLV